MGGGKSGLALVWILFAAIALTLQWQSGVLTADLGGTDESAHFLNGVMVRDYVAHALPTQPVAYARNYYMHYPKIAIGHWPPLFAILLGLWLLPAKVTAALAFALLALMMATLATLVFEQVRQAGIRWPLALFAGLLLLTLPLGRFAMQEVMIEPLCALLMMISAILYARYLDSGTLRDSVWFGVSAVIALYAKPNAATLALLPPLCVILGKRWSLLKTAAFWIPLPMTLLLAGPWYYWTRHLLQGELVPGQTGSFLERVEAVSRLTILAGLNPLGIATILLGAAGWFVVGTGLKSRAQVFGSLAFSVLVIHTAVSPHHETRHYLLALPGVLVGFGWLLGRMPPMAAGVVAVAVLALQGSPLLPPKPDTGMTQAALYVLDHRGELGTVYLVCSKAGGEGAFIAAVALNEPRPTSYVLRSTKMLTHQTWMGLDYRLLFHSSEELARMLEQWQVGAIAVDQTDFADSPDRTQLNEALRAHPEDWQAAMENDRVKLWVRRDPWTPSDLSSFRRELAERLSPAWR